MSSLIAQIAAATGNTEISHVGARITMGVYSRFRNDAYSLHIIDQVTVTDPAIGVDIHGILVSRDRTRTQPHAQGFGRRLLATFRSSTDVEAVSIWHPTQAPDLGSLAIGAPHECIHAR